MKPNLKDFPDLDGDLESVIMAVTWWKEDFEAALREKLEYEESKPRYMVTQEALLKEILGSAQKEAAT